MKQSKLSKQEKVIIDYLKAHEGHAEMRILSNYIAELYSRKYDLSVKKEAFLDNAKKYLAAEGDLKELLKFKSWDMWRKIQNRQKNKWLTNSHSASFSRSIKRLIKRKIIYINPYYVEKSVWLVEMVPKS